MTLRLDECYGDFSPATPVELTTIVGMGAWSRKRVILNAVACLYIILPVSAQMVEVREYHGRKVQCVHSGIFPTNGTECGTQQYARVFSGTVKSAFDIGDTDKLLQITPEEVFLGEPASEVMAVTNQACLHREIRAGEKWLFYLYRNPQTNGLVLPYDSPSKPLEQAQQDIATLRHLSKLTDTGILTGHVLASHKIVAKRLSDDAEYSSVTDADGNYEFELKPGTYLLTANTIQGLWGPEATPSVSKRGCTRVNLWLHIDGRIAGTVTNFEGKAARHVQIAIIPVSPSGESFTVLSDDQGHFEVGGRQPGQYIVGVGLLSPVSSAEWASRVYYPGVRTREQAKIIELSKGEWRTDVNFKLILSSAGP
jgi:hypothetical protein